MKVHIIAGSEGGSGKTLNSLMILDHAVNLGRTALFFDANPNNQSSASVLTSHFRKQKPEWENERIEIYSLEQNQVWLACLKQVSTDKSSSSRELEPSELPILIEDILKLAEIVPNVCIIDTALNLHRIHLSSNTANTIWFNWGLESLINRGEAKLIEDADANLQQNFESNYRINFVLNAFAITYESAKLLKKNLVPTPFGSLTSAKPSNEIGMLLFTRTIADKLRELQTSGYHVLPESYLLMIARQIYQTNGSRRPKNVLCVPAHPNMTDYRVLKFRNLESVKQLRQTIFQPIFDSVLPQLADMDI
jgi:hypothetical protein